MHLEADVRAALARSQFEALPEEVLARLTAGARPGNPAARTGAHKRGARRSGAHLRPLRTFRRIRPGWHMLSAIKTWLPGLTLYALGAIAPVLIIVLMTR